MTQFKVLLLLVALPALIFSCLGLLWYNFYVFFQNATSHTGLHVREIALWYLIQAIIAAVTLFFIRRRIILLCLIVGLLGATEIYLLDHFEVMMDYDDWAPNGLKERASGCWFVMCQ